jgi:hypothetical protein
VAEVGTGAEPRHICGEDRLICGDARVPAVYAELLTSRPTPQMIGLMATEENCPVTALRNVIALCSATKSLFEGTPSTKISLKTALL